MLLKFIQIVQFNLEGMIGKFFAGIMNAVPKLLSGILFIFLSYIAIRIILKIVREILKRIYFDNQKLIIELFIVIIGIFLWFGVALALLKIVGLGDIAVSIGNATGFIGLGIAYALKDMISDTVAGVYLIRDPDFNIGDNVETESVSGVIKDIDLRKTRIQGENNNLIVLANSDVEKKWIVESKSKNIQSS